MYAYQAMLKNNTEFEDPRYEVYKKCNCLPACSSLDYEMENSYADFVLVEKIFVTNEYTPEDQANSAA